MSLESYVTGLMKKQHPGAADKLVLSWLSALEKLYLSGVEKKRRERTAAAVSAGIPVISVGNIIAGGTGKTPCIMLIAQKLLAKGRRPAILTRGYRSGLEKTGGIVSDGSRILVSQEMAGDEPYMMALKLPEVPILVGKDRLANVEKAKQLGADVLLLDDGFQYWQLRRDEDIVLLDATNPFGYRHALPRGLLREPLSALSRAGLFILTKSDQVEQAEADIIKRELDQMAPGKPVLSASHSPSAAVPFSTWKKRVHEGPLSAVEGKKAFLLCGIGNPGAFETTAAEAGLVPAGGTAYDDHHAYTERDIHSAASEAKALGADLVVTTEKDAVKMLHLSGMETLDIPVYVLEIEMKILGGEDIPLCC